MTKFLFAAAFLLGASVVLWIGAGFIGSDILALTVTVIIGAVYVIGFIEQLQFRQATLSLTRGLNAIPEKMNALDEWLIKLHPSLQNSTRLRIEGERISLPGPVLTPYLVGLLVMLGLLGTFVGMVVTLKGAVLALEGSTELQAIRSGLARPIEGLGLAFGTSVAGVAASAMLGLISTLNRRDRMLATRELDQKIAHEFRPFSLAHNRQETFKALQFQAQALPDVAEKLAAVASQLENMGNNLEVKLVQNQESFHQSVSGVYSELAESVETALKTSLADSARMASEGIKPIVAEAMSIITKESHATYDKLDQTTQNHLTRLAEQFSKTSHEVSNAWKSGIQAQEHTNGLLIKEIESSLAHFSQQLEKATENLVATFENSAISWLEKQQAADEQRIDRWNQCLNNSQTNAANELQSLIAGFSSQMHQMTEEQKATLSALGKEWEKSGENSLQQQQKVAQLLEKTILDISNVNQEASHQLIEKIAGLVKASETLVETRIASEENWLNTHNDRMDQLTETLKQELAQLRNEEAQRGDAAVARISQLEEVASQHLTALGQSLEAPMQRLIETASETPKAAAEVIEQLRREISNNIERDNSLLEERNRIMESLDALLASLEQTSAGQREAIEKLVNSSTNTLKEVSVHFAEQVNSEVSKLNEVANNFAGSAIEISTLGETFNYAVELFNESNQQLIDNLNRIEEAMDKSNAKSDEQLAYYVAQAREIIDHSMMSQKEVFEQLRQLNTHEPVAEADEVS